MMIQPKKLDNSERGLEDSERASPVPDRPTSAPPLSSGPTNLFTPFTNNFGGIFSDLGSVQYTEQTSLQNTVRTLPLKEIIIVSNSLSVIRCPPMALVRMPLAYLGCVDPYLCVGGVFICFYLFIRDNLDHLGTLCGEVWETIFPIST